ncbi:MAG: endonuclease III domain-containing protein [Gammaproteobacteria bacterium]|nr:endonuclease III domain-containing protein [Gammaproteobacteria bacterium]MCW8839807.1 endonuclease III domain-containing protein [Gammaproteobacteria bacterium]MCW8927202.1 endonuclease III domain-containing protein [Gammaproteobacteria bacterium]MCW8957727.1 endonuclease III domain-containing protein [Gammaproteobacteria bacterium]MCW8973937.1 endonuclease III domain-containing protein [Gammaproteobacteria bacterium]
MAATLDWIYERLHHHYGPQHWWPADTPFEVMVGAILTQNTAWTNVEKAIANLKANQALSAEVIAETPHQQLAAWIRPSGYFNIKAKRLQNFCRWYLQNGRAESLRKLPTDQLRHELLSVNGVGPETADDMLLYAFHRPVFVIDAYTRRLLSRLGLIRGDEGYETLRILVEEHFGRNDEQVPLFNTLHALIVAHAKDYCRKRPQCKGCPLRRRCPAAE